jgi:uncharacterized damage-inducible protein DinB
MIDPAYVQTMARYNQWQNASLFAAASTLTDVQRREDRGAFFKSIHATLNHLLWGDRTWMSRFSDVARPEGAFPGTAAIEDWKRLAAERVELDAIILAWARSLAPADLKGDLVWRSGLLAREIQAPRWLAIAHFFNHQTHHRGQVHAMLTSAGAKPQETDLILMPQAAL